MTFIQKLLYPFRWKRVLPRGLVCLLFGLLALQGMIAQTLFGLPVSGAKEYSLSSPQDLPHVLAFVDRAYVDPARIDTKEMLKGSLHHISDSVAEILALCTDSNCQVTVDQATKQFPISNMNSIDKLWPIMKEMLTFLDQNYHGEMDKKDIEYIAIDGMLSSLDPHSAMFSPAIYKEFQIGTEGNFGGIGIVIGTRDGELTVIAPIEGTPAWNKGIRAKDKIIQIEDESTINMTLTEAVKRLRGKVGTSVSIVVERENRSKPIDLTLKRADIQIDSIKSSLLTSSEGKKIGYIKIKNFQQDTDNRFTAELKSMEKNGGADFSGLILDLRNNPGGLLQQAIKIADHFISEGIIVSTVGANKRFIEEAKARNNGSNRDYPIVILVNEGSASASEIVAGALKYHNRALILGRQTFGKGSVQTIYELDDGSAVKLTIAEYLPAGQYSIQTIGIIPDIELKPVIIEKDQLDVIENKSSSENDLERHLTKGRLLDTAKSRVQLRYLEQSPVELDSDEQSQKEYSKKVDLIGDFAATLAQQLIGNGLAKNPREIKGDNAFLKQATQDEEKKIEGKMIERGIDWSFDPKVDSSDQIIFTSEFIKKETVIKQASGGDEITLKITAKNNGKAPVYRLAGTTDTTKAFIGNKEFIFGKIMPGKNRSTTATITIPESIANGNYLIPIEFQHATKSQFLSYKEILPIVAMERPKFSYSYELKRPLKGAIPTSTSLSLVVSVKNIGLGAAKETVVAIRNMDDQGAFIDQGRASLGALKPGETKKATLKFHLEPSMKEPKFTVGLSISDTKLFEVLSDKLSISIAANTIEPKEKNWFQAPSIQLVLKQDKSWLSKIPHLLQGSVYDDNQIKDLFIFLDDKKVYYQANVTGSKQIPLSLHLPLKEGNNTITVAARDNNNLISRETMVVYLPHH